MFLTHLSFVISAKKSPKPIGFGGLVGKEGVEPSRLAARDPKSRLSANSSTSPVAGL
jgi:hypothetical protein